MKVYICPICGKRLERLFVGAEIIRTWCEPCKQEIIPLVTPQEIR